MGVTLFRSSKINAKISMLAAKWPFRSPKKLLLQSIVQHLIMLNLIRDLRIWKRRSERHLYRKQLICFISLKWLMLWWFIFTIACPVLQWSWYVGVFNTINLIKTSWVINRADLRCEPPPSYYCNPSVCQFVTKDIKKCVLHAQMPLLVENSSESSICKLGSESERLQSERFDLL